MVMLAAMAEEIGPDSLLWDDPSWEFPSLGVEEEEYGKKLADISNSSDGQAAAKDEEEPAAKGKRRSAAARKGGACEDRVNEGKGGVGESDDHELHIWTERERRKKMRNMFTNLHAMLPHLPPKADKSSIVDEAVNYINKLQQTVEELEKQKPERLRGHVVPPINNPINFDPSTVIAQRKLAIDSREAFLADQGLGAVNNPNALFPGPEFPAIFKTWTSPNVILNVCGKDAHISVCSVRKPRLLTAICFVMEKHKLEVVSAQASSHLNRCLYMIHAHANGNSDRFSQAFAVEEICKQAAAEIMLWVNNS